MPGEPGSLAPTASPSCREDSTGLRWHRFAMFEPICDDPEGQCLRLGTRLRLGFGVDQHTRQGGHLGDPTAVAFALYLYPHGTRSVRFP